MAEIEIQNAILTYLNMRGDCFAFRVNTAGIYDPIKKVFRNPGQFSLKGTADIIGVIQGRFLAIEVKTEKGKVSKEQEAFLMKVEKMAGLAFVARSLEGVQNALSVLFQSKES